MKQRRKGPYEQVIEWCMREGIPGEVLRMVPDSYTRYGSTVVLRFSPGVSEEMERRIAEGWAEVLRAKTVLKITGIVKGVYRQPTMTRIYGPGGDVTHKENGIIYRFDPEKVMFSKGNVPERLRIAKMDMSGETVVDLFAGIGYFALPAAIHARAERVYACEINPTAFHYLEENIRLNNAKNVVPLFGDNRDNAPTGVADRVLMGYVGTTHLFLPLAFRTLKKEGIIHYHEVCSVDRFPEGPAERVRKAAKESGVKAEVLRVGKVKSYGPAMVHVVVDVRVIKGE